MSPSLDKKVQGPPHFFSGRLMGLGKGALWSPASEYAAVSVFLLWILDWFPNTLCLSFASHPFTLFLGFPTAVGISGHYVSAHQLFVGKNDVGCFQSFWKKIFKEIVHIDLISALMHVWLGPLGAKLGLKNKEVCRKTCILVEKCYMGHLFQNNVIKNNAVRRWL